MYILSTLLSTTGFKINHKKIHKQCCVKVTYHRQLVNSSPKNTIRNESLQMEYYVYTSKMLGFVATKLINV